MNSELKDENKPRSRRKGSKKIKKEKQQERLTYEEYLKYKELSENAKYDISFKVTDNSNAEKAYKLLDENKKEVENETTIMVNHLEKDIESQL